MTSSVNGCQTAAATAPPVTTRNTGSRRSTVDPTRRAGCISTTEIGETDSSSSGARKSATTAFTCPESAAARDAVAAAVGTVWIPPEPSAVAGAASADRRAAAAMRISARSASAMREDT